MSKTTFLGDFSCPTFSGSKLGGVGYCITIIGRINRFVWGEFFSMKHFCHKRRNFLTPDLRNSSFLAFVDWAFRKKVEPLSARNKYFCSHFYLWHKKIFSSFLKSIISATFEIVIRGLCFQCFIASEQNVCIEKRFQLQSSV